LNNKKERGETPFSFKEVKQQYRVEKTSEETNRDQFHTAKKIINGD